MEVPVVSANPQIRTQIEIHFDKSPQGLPYPAKESWVKTQPENNFKRENDFDFHLQQSNKTRQRCVKRKLPDEENLMRSKLCT